MAKKIIDITKHVLVPKHTKLSEKAKATLIKQYSESLRELPKITISDPALQHLDVKEGDVIKIDRDSHTAGKIVFYRRVVNV